MCIFIESLEIDTDDGPIDDVAPNRMISLSMDAYLPDETIFGTQLELIHGLIVANSSNIEDPSLEKILSNPTLKQARFIEVSCDFRNLRVDGHIIVNGLLNGMDVDTELDKYVLETEQPMQVYGFKDIKEAQTANIQTNLINTKDVSSFVTLDTDQTLVVSKISSSALKLEHLRINGLFDFINFTELYDTSIRTFGDQVTEASIFLSEKDNSLGSDLIMTARNLIVKDYLNEFPAKSFVDHTNFPSFKGLIEGAQVNVNQLFLNGNLRGLPVINGHSLEAFDKFRWSKSREQIISAPVFIETVTNTDFDFSLLNSNHKVDVLDALNKMRDFKDGYSNYKIDELHIGSDATFVNINEENMHQLWDNVIWLNQSNELPPGITCLDEVWLEDTVYLQGKLNGQDGFLSRVVWKTKGNEFRLKGNIKFRKGLAVEGNIKTYHLNGVTVESFLTKRRPIINGNVNGGLWKIHSALKVTYWDIFENFPAVELEKMYRYDSTTDTHIIRADRITFHTAAVLPNFFVGGSLNEVPNIQEFLSGIQRLDSPRIVLRGTKGNLKKFWFRDLNIESINEINLDDFLRHAVDRSGESMSKEITGKVQFSNVVESSVVEAGHLFSNKINGWDFQNWFGNTIQFTHSYRWKSK